MCESVWCGQMGTVSGGNMNSSISPLVSQFAVLSFPVLTYAAGIVMALIWWRRWPQCCALVFSGLLVLLVTSILQPVITQYIFNNRGAAPAITMGEQLAKIGMVTSFVR